MQYRADLDGLRGIAILAVLGFHAFPSWAPGGFVGVDVFFVLSGYLITGIILEQLRGSTFTLADFYVRRVRRLFPSLAVVLAACLVFGCFALLPEELKDLGKHVGAAAAFVLNFAVWREGGYFDTAASLNPVLHLWSLGIEEQFYLAWPLALLLLWRWPRILVGALGALVAASFTLNILFLHTDPRGAFFLPVTRFWELGLGCLVAVTGLRAHRLMPVLGVGLILGAVLLLDEHTPFPGWAALLPAAGALCVICPGPGQGGGFRQHVLAARPLVFVGLISYPLYLWHWPLLSFATILGSGTVPVEVRAVIVALSFVLSYLVFRFIEMPIRTRLPLRSSAALATSLGTLGIAGLMLFSASGIASRFGHDVRALRPPSRINHYCLEVFPGKEDFNYCKSTGTDAPQILFLGDSRTQALYDAMVSLAKSRYPMMLLARGGCPPMLNGPLRESAHREVSCNETWWHFVQAVHSLRPRVVVLVGGGSDFFSQDTPTKVDLEFQRGLGQLVTELQETATVIYVREIPGFDTGPACFLRPIKVPWGECAPVLPRATMEQRMEDYNRAVDAVQSRFPTLVVVDSMSSLCGSKYCAQKLGSGELLYRDPLHLTASGARRVDRSSGLFAALNDMMDCSGADSCARR